MKTKMCVCHVAVLSLMSLLAFAGSARAAEPYRYVKEGLIAQWDALDGPATTSEWTDILGGRAFTFAGNVSVENGHVVFSGDAGAYGLMSADDSAFVFGQSSAKLRGTIEIVVKETDGSSRTILNTSTGVNLYRTSKSDVRVNWYSYLWAWPWTDGAVDTISITCQPRTDSKTESTKVFLNGAETTSSGGKGEKAISSVTYLGNASATGNSFNGSIYAIRVYSRHLTASEAAANRRADLARFQAKVVPPANAGIGAWTGSTVVADLRDTDYYTVRENAGGVDEGTYPVVLSLRNPSATTWDDGSTSDKAIDFKVKRQVVLEPATDAETNYQNITAAIDSAEEGETILLSEGTYLLGQTISINRGVTLKGADRDTTVIDCQSSDYKSTASCRAFSLSAAGAGLRDLKIIRARASSGYGSGASISDGVISNCWFDSCGTGSGGGGVYAAGGLVQDCKFTKCHAYSSSWKSWGAAIYVFGGIVRGCDCSETKTDIATAVVNVDSGVLETTRIHGNGTTAVRGIGLCVKGGLAVNCQVYGNTWQAFDCASIQPPAAGISVADGIVAYCTVFGNVIANDKAGQSGINMKGGFVFDSIIWGNGPSTSSAGSCKVSGGTFANNVIDVGLASYPGNVVGDPRFVDAANGDLHISLSSSAAYGAAVPFLGIEADFDGNPRSTSAPTCGCYEYEASEEPLGVEIALAASDVGAGMDVTAQAIITGASEDEVDISWTLDGQVLENETAVSLTLKSLVCGKHSIAVSVVRKSGGAPVAQELPDGINVHPWKCHVNVTGSAEYPYDTEAKGAHSVKDAVAAVWGASDVTGVVCVAAGTWPLDATVTLDRNVRIVGEDRDTTVIDCQSLDYTKTASCRAFSLDASGAALCNLKIIRARASSGYGSGANMTDGVISNCWFDSCGVGATGGGGVYLTGGLVSNCKFTRCWAYDGSYWGAKGAALGVFGGTVRNCDCSQTTGDIASAVVHVGAGVLESTKIHDNGSSNRRVVALCVEGGTVYNCEICRNVCQYFNWEGESHRRPLSAGISLKGGTVAYCTVSGNLVPGNETGLSGINMTGGTVVNSIIWGNGPAGSAAGSCNIRGGSFENNVIDVDLASYPDNRVGDPLFVDAANGDYHLAKGSSPACCYARPMADVVFDIEGQVRSKTSPTCGSHEKQRRGLVIYFQ